MGCNSIGFCEVDGFGMSFLWEVEGA